MGEISASAPSMLGTAKIGLVHSHSNRGGLEGGGGGGRTRCPHTHSERKEKRIESEGLHVSEWKRCGFS